MPKTPVKMSRCTHEGTPVNPDGPGGRQSRHQQSADASFTDRPEYSASPAVDLFHGDGIRARDDVVALDFLPPEYGLHNAE